ncbi:MAG: transcriptional regulator [Roseburia sp.]|nr:transcriptional regulator [Roseburia sp.]
MFAKLIKHSLVEKNLKISDLARLLNTSYQNLDQKIKRDNFSEKEMQEIADALQLNLVIELK